MLGSPGRIFVLVTIAFCAGFAPAAWAQMQTILGVPMPGYVGDSITLSLSCPPPAVPTLSTAPTLLLALSTAVLGWFWLKSRAGIVLSVFIAISVSLLPSTPVSGADCSGTVTWSAESSVETFGGSGSDFTFVPTAAGVFDVIAEANGVLTETTVTVCEIGEVLSSSGSCESPPLLDYLGTSRTTIDCTSAGGSVVPIVGDSNGTEVCRFEQPACPGAWSPAASWSTTSATQNPWSMNHPTFSTTCNGISYSWPSVSGSGALDSGSHGWANQGVESEICLLWRPPVAVMQTLGSCSNPLITQVTTSSVPPGIMCGGVLTVSSVEFRSASGSILSRWERGTNVVVANATTTQRGCY